VGADQPAREDCLARLAQPIVELLRVSRNEPLVQSDSAQRPWSWARWKSVAAATTMSGERK
jgi:hypothetical protein